MESRVGRYVVVRQIGRGAMGTVFEAIDPSLQRRVAVKVLCEDDVPPSVVERLRREAAIVAGLRHPNIVNVHEIGAARDEHGRALHFIAMELVEGGTLAQRMAARGADLARLVEDVARAVAHAHAQGVVHRDIKPANVLLSSDGRAVLADFGLAHADGSRLTRSNAVLGTPTHMAPEQVEGRTRDVDARTDVYALGVMLYEAIYGRVPFTARTAAELFRKILEEEPERRGRTVDPDLDVICRKAMEKERGRRYATAAAFADDLARHRRGEAILARPPSLATALGTTLRRWRAPLLAGAGAVVAVLLVLALWSVARERGRLRDWVTRAEAAEKSGRTAEARDAYRAALAIDPSSAAARAGLARVGAGAGGDREARLRSEEEARRRVARGRPAIDRAWTELYRPDARYEDLVQCVEQGQGDIEEAIRLAPDLAVAHYLLGRAWSIRGDDARAEACWRRALALDAAFGRARVELGRLLASRMLGAMVEETPEREITAEPRPTSPGRRAALARFAEEAGAAFLEASDGDGIDDPIERATGRVILALGRHRPDAFERAAREAIAAYGDRRGMEDIHFLLGTCALGAEREACFDRALRIRPLFPEARFARGILRSDAGRVDEAIEDYTSALRVRPAMAEALCNRGRLRRTRGELDAAIADYDEALRVRGRFVTGYLERALAWIAKREFQRAVEDATAAIDLGAVNGYGSRSVAKRGLGDVAGALADADRAIEARPNDAAFRVERALARDAAGDPDGAMSELAEAIRLEPRFAEAYVTRAGLRGPRGDLDGAIADCEEALRIDAHSVEAYGNRGMARRAKGDLKGAIEDFSAMVAIAPGRGDAFARRGLMHEALGRHDEAIADLDRAIALGESGHEAFYTRAAARYNKGDRAGARADFEEALRKAPAGWPMRAQVEEVLKGLR